jgi:hypothetical protein
VPRRRASRYRSRRTEEKRSTRWLDGKGLRPLSLGRRKRLLERLIPAPAPVLGRIFGVEEHGRALFAAAERLDLEGIVAKRLADAYAASTVWLKVKNRAYTQMEGRWDLFGRRGRARAVRQRTDLPLVQLGSKSPLTVR